MPVATAASFAIHKVYYAPGLDVVTIAVEALNGPFKGKLQDLYTSQAKLQARAAAGVPWGDAEVEAETRELLGAMNAELVERCSHGTLLTEPCAKCTVDAVASEPVPAPDSTDSSAADSGA